MKNKMIAIFAAFVMALTLLAATPASAAPADAPVAKVQARKGIFNDVTHASDDSGYVADIHIYCGKHVWLSPGESSALGTTANCGAHVEKIIVGYNQTVYCKNYLPPYQNVYYYTGTTNLPSYSSMKCYMQRPL